MNHLLAKTKGRNGRLFKVISNEEIFELPDDLDNPIEYDSDYKLEDDEWFAIEDFSEQEYSIDFIERRFVSAEYDQIAREYYSNINYLCAYQAGVYYFQKVGSRQFISKKLLSLNSLSITENEPIIVINDYADAIYVKSEDTLYFKKLTAISTIFKGIDTLYKEATQEDTEDFLESEFISLGENYNADKVKKANRKRIAMAMETINNFNQEEKSAIFTYVREYCEDLDFDEDDENFTIESENDLKSLLWGIEQRYYTTLLGNEKRVANSVTALE